jgi:hypothetical protein
MKWGCSICEYEGPLISINDMSIYLAGYACPNCGIMQIKTSPLPKEKKIWWKRLFKYIKGPPY